jgi:aspartate carbamoyltransferase catalytic subunit
MSAKLQHVIESQQFDRALIAELFALADSLEKENTHPLTGKILATLFYEPSTRTRLSFESAMHRLDGGVIATENAREFSSAAKGETVEDTIRMMNHYADAVVIRHFEKGAAARAAAVATIPVINAGDGAGQHPTQALLDLYTVYKEAGKIDGIHIAFVGDLKNGRTVRSLAYLLGKYDGIKMTFISPPSLAIGEDIKEYLTRSNVSFEELNGWDGVLSQVDVLYVTRIQKERFEDQGAYEKVKGSFVLTMKEEHQMKEGAFIMHPLPRVDEIAVEVDSSEKALYFKQARYGVLIRMALLTYLLS